MCICSNISYSLCHLDSCKLCLTCDNTWSLSLIRLSSLRGPPAAAAETRTLSASGLQYLRQITTSSERLINCVEVLVLQRLGGMIRSGWFYVAGSPFVFSRLLRSFDMISFS